MRRCGGCVCTGDEPARRQKRAGAEHRRLVPLGLGELECVERASEDSTITCRIICDSKAGPRGGRLGSCLSHVSCRAQSALSRSIRSLKYSSTQMAIAVYNRSVFSPPQYPVQLIIALSGHRCWSVIIKSERTRSLVDFFHLARLLLAPSFTLGLQQCCCRA
jgi:hypothetical protein